MSLNFLFIKYGLILRLNAAVSFSFLMQFLDSFFSSSTCSIYIHFIPAILIELSQPPVPDLAPIQCHILDGIASQIDRLQILHVWWKTTLARTHIELHVHIGVDGSEEASF